MIPSESIHIISQPAYKIISTLFPTALGVLLKSLIPSSVTSFLKMYTQFLNGRFWQIEDNPNMKMFLSVTFHLARKAINKVKYDMRTI